MPKPIGPEQAHTQATRLVKKLYFGFGYKPKVSESITVINCDGLAGTQECMCKKPIGPEQAHTQATRLVEKLDFGFGYKPKVSESITVINCDGLVGHYVGISQNIHAWNMASVHARVSQPASGGHTPANAMPFTPPLDLHIGQHTEGSGYNLDILFLKR